VPVAGMSVRRLGWLFAGLELVALVTVLQEEHEAVRRYVESLAAVPPTASWQNDHAWEYGEIPAAGNRGIYRVVLGLAGDKGTSSGLQTVEAVQQFSARIPDARPIVLDGDSYHIAAVEPETCARHALAFMAEVAARR